MNIDNIFKIDDNTLKEKIELSISETKNKLNGLTVDTMCMVYSSYLYSNLKKHNIPCHIIDTNDLNIDYEHRFVLVPKGNNYYLLDLTFSQFKKDTLPDLTKKGYDLMTKEKWDIYLKTISNTNQNIDIDEAYYKM